MAQFWMSTNEMDEWTGESRGFMVDAEPLYPKQLEMEEADMSLSRVDA